jgi:iron-sulfur cluster assembly protein
MQFTLTPAAEKFIRRMLGFSDAASSGFRLAVSAGGCSGLAAQFDVGASPRAGDAAFESGGIRLFLPAESRLLLDGVTVDFAETPTQGALLFHDPKTANCGFKSAEQATIEPAGAAP